jgi:hypothetical protein
MPVNFDSTKGYTHLTKDVYCPDSSVSTATLSLSALAPSAPAALYLSDTQTARTVFPAEVKALQSQLRSFRSAGLPCNLATVEAAYARALPILSDIGSQIADRSPRDARWRFRRLIPATSNPGPHAHAFTLKGPAAAEIVVLDSAVEMLDFLARRSPDVNSRTTRWPTAAECGQNPLLLELFFILQLIFPFAVRTSYDLNLPAECDDAMDLYDSDEDGNAEVTAAEVMTCVFPPSIWIWRYKRKAETIFGNEDAVHALLAFVEKQERETTWGQLEEYDF